MFYNCSSLKKINLNNFITNKVINMEYMFGFCSLLKELDISNFKINENTNIFDMFRECGNLRKIYVNDIKTNKIKKYYDKEKRISFFSTYIEDEVFTGCTTDLKILTKIQK